MRRSIKIAIALAVAIPLVLVGGGLLGAADQFGCCRNSDGSALPQLNSERYSVRTLVASACGDCAGDCFVEGRECERNDRCAAQCINACTSNCIEENCGSNCGNVFPTQRTGCLVRCGTIPDDEQVSASDGEPTWWSNGATIDYSDAGVCVSCDVAGLNEYPPNSPHYTGGD